MSVEFCAGDLNDVRRQIEPLDYRLREAGCRDGRWNCHRRRGDAANAGFDAKVTVTVLGARGRLVGKAAVADNHIRLAGRFGHGLCCAEARDQSGERNRISSGERDYALPQWPLGEHHAH